jgi:DNA-directed RNA polymerase subunit E'
MYELVKIKEKVRVPPKEFGEKLNEAVLKIVQEEYEGLIDEDLGVVIAITHAENIGEGKVVPGDGSAYHTADLTMLVYKPIVQEVVEGYVSEITEFGAFLRISPIEGLVHVSQIMDDFINFDAKLPGFVGKKTNKRLIMDDVVMARIVTVSLKDAISNSKIGLTMRQPYLGKSDWKPNEEKGKKTEGKTAKAEKPAPKGKGEK